MLVSMEGLRVRMHVTVCPHPILRSRDTMYGVARGAILCQGGIEKGYRSGGL